MFKWILVELSIFNEGKSDLLGVWSRFWEGIVRVIITMYSYYFKNLVTPTCSLNDFHHIDI